MANEIQSVSIIGAGNVATHLALSLAENGIQIVSVSGKGEKRAAILAAKLDCPVVSDLSKLPESDLVLVCVGDDTIASVLNDIPSGHVVAYTSGSVELQAMPQRQNLGVFYPLQTFSVDKTVNIFEVPFLIEAGNQHFAQSLFDLAWKLTRKVQFASSTQRKYLHLGAVLVNNFTNHLAYLAKSYLDKHELDWELLKPLMQETFEKLKTTAPYDAQTGPARRHDTHTIQEHISMLEGLPKEIYSVISCSIENTYNSNKSDD